ncbi:ABC transporter substrate-binding protein [Candidatus Contubernalis alkaliaceticus]|uniref:ABC transporter substrate-binding protein n=1 Tax=Candidatus Contubernalis alkaliaceticus TaxID=338645 RepID=UPI001F4C326B|nr:ABC transporter substrate-binding protein [Candidatus Contubernalis alkalaceticus]UNC92204.1 ABC transporter substrate-binding protein [Candidatus Contubernalis alkalaceticus]
MKKLSVTILVVGMLVAMLAGCSSNDVPVIGISQYGEHASLDNCREGFLQGLKNAGLVEGKDFKIDYQNAGFDDEINIRIAQTFASNNVNLMVGIATPSATALYAAAEGKDIPVVFTAITDPVEAKLDSGNVTGTSDKLPVEAQLELIREMQPDADTIGIIYTTSEPNSVSAIREYKEKAPEYNFTIDAIGVTQQSEVTLATDTLIASGVDAFSNLTDNNVVGVLPSILDKTNKASIPVYGSEVEQVKIGCVAAAGIDYYKLGIQTGEIAVKILNGEFNASEIPYETILEFSIYINKSAIDEMGMSLPDYLEGKTIDIQTPTPQDL